MAPEVAPKVSKIAGDAKSMEKVGGKKRKNKKTPSNAIYIHRVLKQVNPKLRISSTAMSIMVSMVDDLFERLCVEAATLTKYTGRRTLSSNGIQSAARLVLPGELSKHAVSEGTKAIRRFSGPHAAE
uniref:Histone domain-containing protein n=1 Tax=Steinernema glaseri TaxID=37863 RepID=A0A1I8AJC7_9BILA